MFEVPVVVIFKELYTIFSQNMNFLDISWLCFVFTV